MSSACVKAAAAYIAGIYMASLADPFFVLLFAVCFGAVVLLRFLLTRRVSGTMVLIVSAATVGMAAYQYANDSCLRRISVLEEKYVTLEGGITELPEAKEDGLYSYILTTVKTEYNGQEYPAGDQIRISSREKFKFAEHVQVSGFLERFKSPGNSGEFDTARYYKSHGIYYKMYAREARVLEGKLGFYSLHYAVNCFRSKLGEKISQYFTGDEAALLKAVLTGNKHEFSPDFEKLLYRSNTMRYLYSPYIHMLMIVGMIGFFFGSMKKKFRDWILIAVLILYAGINSSTPIFAKTCLLTAAGTWFLQRYGYSHLPDLLSFVVLLVTLLNPLYAFDIGFILSVACSLLIYHFRDFTVLAVLSGRGRFVRKTLAMWILTSIGMLPLCAYFFDGTAPYSPLLILIYMPCIILLILVSPIFFLVQAVSGQGFGLNYFMAGMLFILRKIPVLVDNIPFSYIRLGRPSILFLAIFYLGLMIVKWVRWRELHESKAVAAMSACAGFAAVLVMFWVLSLGKLSLIFVNVGQGDGAVLHIPMGETIIIDGGGGTEYSAYDAGDKVFLPYLSRMGYYTIDLAVVSHYHRDHCLGVIAAMKELAVQDVLIPGVDPANPYRAEIEQIAREKNIRIHYLGTGKQIKFPSGLTIRILSPDLAMGAEYADLNDTSLVLEISYGEFKALFTGDMTAEIEENLAGKFSDYDLVKVPHHGSKTSSTEEFIRETKPEIAVVSVGEDNTYGLPDAAVIQRYRQAGAAVLSTSELGDITVTVDKAGNIKYAAYAG